MVTAAVSPGQAARLKPHHAASRERLARGAFVGALEKKPGLTISSEVDDKRERAYRIID